MLCVDASLVEIGHLVFKMKLKISKVYNNDKQQKKTFPEKLSLRASGPGELKTKQTHSI